MTLILSCITRGEAQARSILEHLTRLGIPAATIIVLHPGDPAMLAHPVTPNVHAENGTTVGAAASSGAAAGMFGWLVGFGVFAFPGALLVGTIGAVAGAAIGATRHAVAAHVPEEVQHHYAERIVDDQAAILVKVADDATYQTVLTAFLAHDGRHILTSRNDTRVAESDQLAVLAHHPARTECADAAGAGR